MQAIMAPSGEEVARIAQAPGSGEQNWTLIEVRSRLTVIGGGRGTTEKFGGFIGRIFFLFLGLAGIAGTEERSSVGSAVVGGALRKGY